jgi:hypothetical protein
MSLTKLLTGLGLCCALPLSAGATSAEIADLAARIEYGFYSDDVRVIEAARTVLERLGDTEADARFYLGLAELRLAQLAVHRGADASAHVERCIERATPKGADEKGPAAAEPWILAAACAAVGEQARRRDHALERARSLAPNHPRVALLTAWAITPKPLQAPAAVRETVAVQLEKAVAAFDAWTPPPGAPDWGQAEALTQLGGIALQRGEVRAARDWLERALLLAPDYRVAVELQNSLQPGRPRR